VDLLARRLTALTGAIGSVSACEACEAQCGPRRSCGLRATEVCYYWFCKRKLLRSLFAIGNILLLLLEVSVPSTMLYALILDCPRAYIVFLSTSESD
jgi:hypothetical protein